MIELNEEIIILSIRGILRLNCIATLEWTFYRIIPSGDVTYLRIWLQLFNE